MCERIMNNRGIFETFVSKILTFGNKNKWIYFVFRSLNRNFAPNYTINVCFLTLLTLG